MELRESDGQRKFSSGDHKSARIDLRTTEICMLDMANMAAKRLEQGSEISLGECVSRRC